MTKVYKVVCPFGKDVFKSFAMRGKYQALYKLGTATTPPIGSLMAFDSYYTACKFASEGSVILLCEARLSRVSPIYVAFFPNEVQVLEYWEKVARGYSLYEWKHNPNLSKELVDLPDGTVFCDWIKPIRIEARYIR